MRFDAGRKLHFKGIIVIRCENLGALGYGDDFMCLDTIQSIRVIEHWRHYYLNGASVFVPQYIPSGNVFMALIHLGDQTAVVYQLYWYSHRVQGQAYTPAVDAQHGISRFSI